MTYFAKVFQTSKSDAKPEKVEKKKPKPIKKNSVKRAEQNKEYLVLREVYLSNNPNCSVKLKGCTSKATEIHHAKKRTGYRLTDVANFVAICRSCHILVENQNIKL